MYTAMVDCKEIRGLWEPKEGDRYLSKIIGNEGVYILPRGFAPDQKTKAREGIIVYLPRQEDIQEMLAKETGQSVLWLFHVLSTSMEEDWMMEAFDLRPSDYFYDRTDVVNAGVIAWLAFYMQRAHNKHWRDGKWQTGGTP